MTLRILLKSIFIVSAAAMLAACGSDETTVTETPIPPQTSVDSETYNGPAPESDDVQNFKLSVWDNIATADKCGACHTQNSQGPFFARNDDINLAYDTTLSLVNLDSIQDSLLVTKVGGGHNCWLSSDSACAARMISWIENWITVDASANEIVLEAPPSKIVGANKNFPEDSALFATHVHPILETYCSACHVSTVAIPISPYIGSSDIDEAYSASISKINLDLPSESRLVARLRDEFHNCWGDCGDNADVLSNAIQAMADNISVTELSSNLIASEAMSLYDGILASGGGRFESNLIAFWEFKTGSGNVAYDTSGITPAIDLTLSGDYEWVGGGGIQFTDGKAQGSTSASTKIYDYLIETGEFSVETWVAPANVTQEGPARIIAYSGANDRRNFMLGQTLYNYDFWLRNDHSDANGQPSLSTPNADEVLQAALQHVVINYDGTNGRTIFVNGQQIDIEDELETSLLNEWDSSFAFVLGNEVSSQFPFAGTIRMVAIHNRALNQEQIVSNFEAGIGERYYLLFGISDIIDIDNSYISFEVSQFDSYSYLFTEPFIVNLDQQSSLDGLNYKGIRIGVNGREESTGQVFSTLDNTVNTSLLNSLGGTPMSRQGTIIPLQKGPELDEFFLSFDTLGQAYSTRESSEIPVATVATDLEPQSQIGIKDFAELNASMSVLTGVSTQNAEVLSTYNTLKQQLPSVTNVGSFLTSNQMAITQLSIKYCDALVEDTNLRASYFPALDFNYDANQGFSEAFKSALITPLTTKMLDNFASSQPEQTEVETELNQLVDLLGSCSLTSSCTSSTTTTVVKASCAAMLGSAVISVQ